MDVVIQTCEKSCIQVRWTVGIPRVGQSVSSSWFLVERYNLMLDLMSLWDSTFKVEEWKIFLWAKQELEKSSRLLVSTYVQDEKSDLFMARKQIVSLSEEIWSHYQDLFASTYPQIKVIGNKLTFIFIFDFETVVCKYSQSTEREHKSVQTSSYLDDSHCLKNLSLDFSKLMDDSLNPDVHLTCGDCTIPAHRLVLSARSEVFRAMLQSDMVEGREGSVKIVDMEPKVFEIFIRYLYTGILPELTEDTASSLYEAGDKYNMQALMEKCGDFLAENLTRESVYEILTMADAHNDEDLKYRVVSYVLKEKIHDDDDEWTKFCDDHPKIGMEVFRRAYKKSKR